MGMATTHVETYVVGTLVIDLFDSSTRHLIWPAAPPTLFPMIQKGNEETGQGYREVIQDLSSKVNM
jgi:hypothetical protein